MRIHSHVETTVKNISLHEVERCRAVFDDFGDKDFSCVTMLAKGEESYKGNVTLFVSGAGHADKARRLADAFNSIMSDEKQAAE